MRWLNTLIIWLCWKIPIAAAVTAILLYFGYATLTYQEPVTKHWPPTELKMRPMKR